MCIDRPDPPVEQGVVEPHQRAQPRQEPSGRKGEGGLDPPAQPLVGISEVVAACGITPMTRRRAAPQWITAVATERVPIDITPIDSGSSRM